MPNTVLACILLILQTASSPAIGDSLGTSEYDCNPPLQWEMVSQQLFTFCQLEALELEALSTLREEVGLRPYYLRTNHTRPTDLLEGDLPYNAFLIFNPNPDHPFPSRERIHLSCASTDGLAWSCEEYARNTGIYRDGHFILIDGATERESEVIAEAVLQTPLERVAAAIERHYPGLARSLTQSGWPETFDLIYSITRRETTFYVGFGDFQCPSPVLKIERTFCGQPDCELEIKEFSLPVC